MNKFFSEPLQSDAAMFNGAEYKANGTGGAGARHNIISLDMKNQVSYLRFKRKYQMKCVNVNQVNLFNSNTKQWHSEWILF